MFSQPLCTQDGIVFVCLSIRLGGGYVEIFDAVQFGIGFMADGFAIRTYARKFRCISAAWEDFILGIGIATFSLCRLSSRRVAALADGLVGALGLITLINPILYHYFNAKVAAWNNLTVGFVVFILAIYQDRKDSETLR